jgi:hypothetical protein
MAAQDMTDALKHPHPDVPFATIGDETIMALAILATIFKNKFQKPLAPEAQSSPLKAAENKPPAALIQQALTSPVRPMYQTRSQTINPTAPAHVIQSPNSSLPPRVVTPAARSAAPPRVPARARNLSPRNLSQGDFLDMGSANHSISFGNNHWTDGPMINAVLHPATGKEMQYKDIMKHPLLGPRYKRGFENELGCLCQGIRDIKGTNTCFFVELKSIPKDRKIKYGKLVCDHKPKKAEQE